MCDSAIVISLYACVALAEEIRVYSFAPQSMNETKRDYCSGLYEKASAE